MNYTNVLKVGALIGVALLATACVSKKKYNKEVALAQQEQVQINNLTAANAQLKQNLTAAEATIQQLQDELKVTMLNEVLFAEGSATLTTKGKAALDDVATTLNALQGEQVAVRAFTDNVPISKHLQHTFPTNMDLSSARANEVVRYLVSKGSSVGDMSAQGFGEAYPVASNDTAEGRSQNRRVEIVITHVPMTR